MLAKEDRTAMLLRIYNDATPLVNHHPVKGTDRIADQADPTVASGFKKEDGEIKAHVENSAIEGNGPVDDAMEDCEIEPGPFGDIVADDEAVEFKSKDVKAQKVEKGEDTWGPEQQLNGTGGVEEQLGTIS
jgi:multisite-specific tRNA:(cytosine-C5)-methyltransferase